MEAQRDWRWNDAGGKHQSRLERFGFGVSHGCGVDLFFTASTAVNGAELWSLTNPVSAAFQLFAAGQVGEPNSFESQRQEFRSELCVDDETAPILQPSKSSFPYSRWEKFAWRDEGIARAKAWPNRQDLITHHSADERNSRGIASYRHVAFDRRTDRLRVPSSGLRLISIGEWTLVELVAIGDDDGR